MLEPRPGLGLDHRFNAKFARQRNPLTVFSAGRILGFTVWVLGFGLGVCRKDDEVAASTQEFFVLGVLLFSCLTVVKRFWTKTARV